MAEKTNIVEDGLIEIAKKRGVPVEKVVKEALEYLEKLRKTDAKDANQSADEHENLIKGTKKK